MNSCLQVKVTKVALGINASVNQVCQISTFGGIPLLVDEGYLFVNVNGQMAYIYVKK